MKNISSKLLLATLISSSLFLVACKDDDKKSNNKVTNPSNVEEIKGTVATGKALAGAKIEIVNKDGEITIGTSDPDGKFSVNVKKGAPYFIKASKDDTVLYSYAASAGYVNVTQLTSQAILAANEQAEDRDFNSLEEIFENWKAMVTELSSADEITEALEETAKQAVANLKAIFDQNGYPKEGSYPNIFTYEFDANHTGFDAVLDSVKIDGLDKECKGTGSAYHCDVSYTVGGESYAWSYDVNTNGINLIIDLNDINNGGGTAIPTGNYNLKVTTTVMGQGSSVTINNIPKPANEAEFCGSDATKDQLPDNFVMNSCSFSGNTGTIAATVSAQGFSMSYTVKYEYTPAK